MRICPPARCCDPRQCSQGCGGALACAPAHRRPIQPCERLRRMRRARSPARRRGLRQGPERQDTAQGTCRSAPPTL